MTTRLLARLLLISAPALLALPGCGKPRSLTLLYTNDEHSHLFAFGPESDDYPTATTAKAGVLRGGVARRKVLLAQERAAAQAAGADTLTVSAGDNAMGTLAQVPFAETAPDFTVLEQLGYDVVCLGNHEFDFGPAALAKSINAATANGGAPQIVASNIHFSSTDPADDTLAVLYGEGSEQKPIKRYHVVTTPQGLKVGFFGILGTDAAYNAPFKAPVTGSGLPSEENKPDVVRPKIYADVQPVVDKLRDDEDVDLVVAISHGGVDLDHPENGDDYHIAKNVSGIDVIVSGHTHTVVDRPIVVKNEKTGKDVLIVQSGSYGRYVGRLALTVHRGKVTYDAARSVLLPVDDTIVPDATTAQFVEGVMKGLESSRPSGAQASFLEGALSRVVGQTVTDDPNELGDLYFYPLAKTDYSIPGLKRFVETDVLNLSADAQLAAAAAALPDEIPALAVQAAGVIRADIDQGTTGTISFADAFRTLPLGFSPIDGSMGYPLTHFYVHLWELKAALELGASLGLQVDSFFLGASGVRVTIDTSRPPFDPTPLKVFDQNNGRVVKIEWDSQHHVGMDQYDSVLFDVNQDWIGTRFNLVHVVTNLYIASFASSAGITLKNKNGSPLKLTDTILRRQDGSEVKDYEAFASYLKQLSDENGGTLPPRYNPAAAEGKVPRRNLCSGPLCGIY